MMQLNKICLMLSFCLGFSACDGKGDAPELIPPTNLMITIDDSQSNQGIVAVLATAEQVNFFEFNFGDNVEFTRDKGGVASHTYQTSGEYLVTVRAHSTEKVFLEKVATVSVEIDDTPEVVDKGYTTPVSYSGYDLVWQDEFDGDAISSDWTFEMGNGTNGWGNNELQYYRAENATVEDGFLVITAKKESYRGFDYTATRMITKNKKSFKYGRIDIRAKLPFGQGIWPALWMLGDSFSTLGWPACGEIDIMELVGGVTTNNKTHGTVHWDNNGSYASYGDSCTLSDGIFADEFHVFSIIWDESIIAWYVDDQVFNVVDITPEALSEFHESFFFIFNIAVGGNWPGLPNSSTIFPQHMFVDYVRVFQPQ